MGERRSERKIGSQPAEERTDGAGGPRIRLVRVDGHTSAAAPGRLSAAMMDER